jgi:hypothetical protein
MIVVGRADGDRGRSGRALVVVMKPADLGDGDDRPGLNRLNLAPTRAVVSETLVRPRNVVVREVRAKHATQVAFVEHHDEIEAFAANRADDALGEGIQRGVIPQFPLQEAPGSSRITSEPERRALGGHVIGSMATARRRRERGWTVSPV